MAEKEEHLWESEDHENPGVRCWADYNTGNHTFTVSAGKGDIVHCDSFTANFEPRFGIDVADMDQIYEMAGILSDKFRVKP